MSHNLLLRLFPKIAAYRVSEDHNADVLSSTKRGWEQLQAVLLIGVLTGVFCKKINVVDHHIFHGAAVFLWDSLVTIPVWHLFKIAWNNTVVHVGPNGIFSRSGWFAVRVQPPLPGTSHLA